MSKLLVATLTGLLALVLWGTSDWLASKNSKKFTSREVNVAMQVTGMVIMAIVWGIMPKSLGSLADVLILLLASALFTVAYLCFIKGLSLGETSVVVPIGNAYPLITLLLSFIFVAVHFTHLQVLSMVVIVGGSILLGAETTDWRRLHKSFSRAAIYGGAAAVIWGVGFFLISYVVNKLTWQSIEFVITAAMGVYSLAITFLAGRKKVIQILKNTARNRIGIIAGALLTLGAIAFYIGATRSRSILVPAVIASAAPLFTSILAAIFDKEKLILVKRFGAALIVAGIVLLNFK